MTRARGGSRAHERAPHAWAIPCAPAHAKQQWRPPLAHQTARPLRDAAPLPAARPVPCQPSTHATRCRVPLHCLTQPPQSPLLHACAHGAPRSLP